MSKVDIFKKLYSSLENSTCKVPFVFHHVPKCGGTSVARKLRMKYLLSQKTIIPESSYETIRQFYDTEIVDYEDLIWLAREFREKFFLYCLNEDVKCFSAHVRFSEVAYKNFAEKYKFVTVLRDPVERYISHYHYSYSRYDQGLIESSLEDFVMTDRGKRFGAYYPYYFCGAGRQKSYSDEKSVQKAIGNLKKFSIVGILENLQDFEREIKTELGIKIKIGHENKNSKKSHGIDQGLKQEIEKLCEPSYEVYNLALKGF